MQAIDISQTSKSIEEQIKAIKDYNATSAAAKEAQRTEGNSLSQSVDNLSQQLNKITQDVKRYQRDNLSSMDNLLNYLGLTSGTGPQTLQYLRKKIIETATKIEPEIQNILAKQTIRILGCSQEQTFDGFALSAEDLQILPLSQRPVSEGIYIPIESLDFFGNLKQPLDSKFGKFFYEKETPAADNSFVPYGGRIKFPMNKTLNVLMTENNAGRSYAEIFGRNYQGESTQPLFDIQYTDTNGVTQGNYFRVALIDRDQQNGTKLNTIANYVKDYYSTIKLVDPVLIGAQVANLLTGAVSMQTQRSTAEITNQTAFGLIVQRILGLCFDSRAEIDVSGISKIAELDGVDDSFFEFTDVDLRKIDVAIANIQQGIAQFEDCGNVKLPVNSKVVIDELINFRDKLTGNTDSENVQGLQDVIDSVLNNDIWRKEITDGLGLDVSVNKNVIKQMPIAVAAAILTPKVLLPIYSLLAVVQNQASLNYNNAVNNFNNQAANANAFTNSAGNLSGQAVNVVNDGVDFLKQFRSFSIEVISEINSIFLKTLFDLLKRDIVKLMTTVIGDVNKSTRLKNQKIITRLVQVAAIVAQSLILLDDARKCKSLLGSIQNLLNLINGGSPITAQVRVPDPLLFLAEFLPGYSPERATINIIKTMQTFGLETGPLPGGSPNLMALYTYAVTKGMDEEETANGKVQAVGLTPPVVGGLVKISGK